jgi:hypothetical protein
MFDFFCFISSIKFFSELKILIFVNGSQAAIFTFTEENFENL